MQSNRDEVFQFAWNNRSDLGLIDEAYTEVTSIRPVARVSPVDGFALRETVVEIVQRLEVTPPELAAFGIESPQGMPASTRLLLVGGATLIFDEYGQLKFRIPNALPRSGSRSSTNAGLARLYSERLASLWQRGRYVEGAGKSVLVTEDENLFRELHALRGRSPRRPASREQW
jgi:hypothetical protein